jgi:hypothetical protein
LRLVTYGIVIALNAVISVQPDHAYDIFVATGKLLPLGHTTIPEFAHASTKVVAAGTVLELLNDVRLEQPFQAESNN